MERAIQLAKAVRPAATIVLSVALGACATNQTTKPPDLVDAKVEAAEPELAKPGSIAVPAPAKPGSIAVPVPAKPGPIAVPAPRRIGSSAVQTNASPPVGSPASTGSLPFSTRYAHFQPAGWAQLPGWLDDNLAEAWLAFRQSCAVLSKRSAWSDPCAQAGKINANSNESIRQFFQREFTLYEIHNSDRTPEGVITGYYEALLNGSRTRGGAYLYPVYGTPDDLLMLDIRRLPSDRRGEAMPARVEGRNVVPVPGGSAPYVLDIDDTQPDVRDKRLRMRLDGDRIVPYFTRAEIERLGQMKARVLVWVDNPAALYSMQIQGSGKVRLPGGEMIRLAYAEQNGHPFRPPVSKNSGPKTRITTRGLNIELPDDETDPFAEDEAPLPTPTMRGISVGETDRPKAAASPPVHSAERNKAKFSADVQALVEQLTRASPTQGSPANDKPRPVALPANARPPRVATSVDHDVGVPAKQPLAAGTIKAAPVAALPIQSPSTAQLAAVSADPSYVFFREIPDSADGPLGALGVPLTAGRSVAVDPRTTPLGFPLFLATTEPGGKGRLNRLVIAQDTGGAIRGAVRADYFWGFGASAYAQAARMKESGRMWLLLPRGQQIAARETSLRMRGIDGATGDVECVVADPDLCVEDR